MEKALLILFGGRVIPNVLTILYLKPQIIVPIVSEDVLERLDGFKKGVNDLLQEEGHSCKWLDSELGESFVIKAHNKEDIKAICEKVVHKNKYKDDKGNLRDYQWTFNITSGTSIMSIAAYEAAKELNKVGKPVSCWYLNTAQRKVEVLVQEPGNKPEDEDLFRISIEQYATVHNKVLKINSQEDTLPSEEKRLDFARLLVASLPYIRALRKLLVGKDKNNPANQSVLQQISGPNKEQEYYPCERSLDSNEKAVLNMAESYGLIQELTTTKKTSLSFKISKPLFQFLNGGWLELYIQNEVAGIKENGQPLFQDIGRNRHVYNKRRPDHNPQEENELDVSMIYNAQLFIIECKAGLEVTRPETIFKLDSVANAFGAGFVGKYLVTALPKDEVIKAEKDRQKEGNKHETEKGNIEERLDIRKIKLITWEDLNNLKAIFRKEAVNPQFQRM